MVNTGIRLIIFFVAKEGEAMWSAKASSGADCASDCELLIVKFRLKLKKAEKTTRPFRYDLNQVPYDYTVEMANRSKGSELVESLGNYGQKSLTLYRTDQNCLHGEETWKASGCRGTLRTAATSSQQNSFHV